MGVFHRFVRRTIGLGSLAFALISLTPSSWGQAPLEFQVGAFNFLRPDAFVWIPPTSAMRKAELSVSGETGAAEITFFHFGAGQGGTPQANIQRWLSQFQEPLEQLNASTATQQIGATNVTLLSAQGTFLSGMPGQPTSPMPGFALRGAILEHADGDVYVKMTGPASTVEGAAEAFDRMVLEAAAQLTANPKP
jgi:hypothetical protein